MHLEHNPNQCLLRVLSLDPVLPPQALLLSLL